MVSHSTVRFSGRWHCGRGDVVTLALQVILQGHMIEESGQFMSGSPS